MDSTGGGGDSVVGMDGGCTRIYEAVSDTVSSEDHLSPGWRSWSGVLVNLLLNLSTIVADAVTFFRKM